MCGIWGYFTLKKHTSKEVTKIVEAFYNVKPRGPDNSSLKMINEFVNCYIGFHRLSIMDTDNRANQPFMIYENKDKTIFVTCNGEIYNYEKIYKEENYTPETGSDTEVIVYLYKKYGVQGVKDRIDGEFAVTIIEVDKNNQVSVHLIRDHIGIRPLYFAYDPETQSFAYASDLKGLTADSGDADEAWQIVKNAQHVKPGHHVCVTWSFDKETKSTTSKLTQTEYFTYNNVKTCIYDVEEAKNKINATFRTAVIDRLMTHRPLGSLLSGGLDSSLVAAIAAEAYNSEGRKLRTFSVGMPGATDRKYAEMVAKHINSEHTHVEFSEKDFLEAIDETVKIIGSFDITTIRASVGLVLISKWISEKTDIKVLLTGEGSDELNSGYMYFHNAPSPEENHKENLRLLNELYIYDLLRGDRSIADFGLEARIPFLDRKFMETVLSVDSKLRLPTLNKEFGFKIEKWLVRSAFEQDNLLPKEALWRKKEAFSDGVSGEKRSWFEVIQEHAQSLYTDEEFEKRKSGYAHLAPVNKESLYFRDIYEKYYGKNIDKIVPHYWLPKWSGDIVEPSARVLNAYKRGEEDEG